MKIIVLISIIYLFVPLLHAQEQVKVEIPETYELSNIILALTDYGIII